ncbi:MAG: hypothetical protein ABJO67_00670 [Pseudoruegeria sp.]
MRIHSCLVLISLLSACSSPTLQYVGESAQSVSRDGLTYSVRQKGDAVEVVRSGLRLRPNQVDIAKHMRAAAEQVTGCAMKDGSFSGDVAVGRFEVQSCDVTAKP